MERGFEKISLEQFRKDVGENDDLYNQLNMPKRGTKNSAGYDFFLINDICLKKGETKKIPTGIKAYLKEDEVLYIIVRSSTGFKFNIRLSNQVGVIDSDYYNNEKNEGHIWISVQNEGEEDRQFKKGECIAQGIFSKYLKTDDDNPEGKRTGGFGSTNGGN